MTKQYRLYFDEDARKIFTTFCKKLDDSKISITGLNYHIRKYDALFARLCVVHHVMRYVPNLCGKSADNADIEHPIPKHVDSKTAQAVHDLISEFLLPHAQKIYSYFGEHGGKPVAEKIAQWILQKKIEHFTRRDIAKFANKQEIKNLDAPLEYLEQMGWIQRKAIGGYQGKGGRPGEKFLVNPAVLSLFNVV